MASGLELDASARRAWFDADLLQSVEQLRILARRVQRDGRHAEQRSEALGAGLEFKDYRPYSPGDDMRAIDWNIYRRLGRVFLRLFEEVEDLPVYLLTDVSRSMYLESPPRAYAGLRAALAIAAVALTQHDGVGLFPFSDTLELRLRPQAGRTKVLRFADAMAACEPGGATDFATSLRRFQSYRLRRGLVVIVSDFFDERGAEAVTRALAKLRHRLLLVQLVNPADRQPTMTGDLQLRDCETGVTENVAVTTPVVEAYRAAYDRFQERLTDFARSQNVGLVRLDVEREVVPQLATLFERGTLLV